MNLTRLRYFVAVANAGNLSRAARMLRIAQPALSRQLRSLESEVGSPLFERHARGVRLTPAGLALLSHAQSALESAEAGLAAARRAAAPANRLTLSTPDWPHRARLVAAAVDELRVSCPSVEIAYSSIAWTVSPRALTTGAVDIGFGIAPPTGGYGPDVAAIPWFPEPGCSALFSASHPLAARASLRLADLRDLPALIPDRDEVGALHDQMRELIRSGGFEPRVVTAPLNFSAGAQMAAIGAGWIVTVNSVAEMPPPGTVVRPLEDAPLLLYMHILHRVGDTRAFVREFVRLLRTQQPAPGE